MIKKEESYSVQISCSALELHELVRAGRKGLDFDTTGALSIRDYWWLTGITISPLNEMLHCTETDLRNPSEHSTRIALAMLIFH